MRNIDTPATTGLLDHTERNEYLLEAPPQSAQHPTTWHQRLRLWRRLRDAPEHLEDHRTLAARDAERRASRRISANHATKYGHVFGNKRIPRDVRASAMGRFEADIIALTPRRVVLIEVKNWSGQLKVAGDGWIQVRRGGEEVSFPNLLTYNREKLRALHRYLRHRGVNISTERFHQAVAFANPRLQIDPSLAEHPAVLIAEDVDQVLGGSTSMARQAAARLAELLTAKETNLALAEDLLKVIPPTMVSKAAEAIGELRSWDRLLLRGGRELQGDIIWLHVTGRRVPAVALQPGSEANLHWRRSYLGLIQWVLRDKPAGMLRGEIFHQQYLPGGRQPLEVTDCAFFHEAGKPQPSLIKLSDVERVQIG